MCNKINLRCYLPFVVSQVKIALAYRMAFFVRILSNLFTVMITWYLWNAIYRSFGRATMNGFTFQEMATYVIVSFFVTVMLAPAQADEVSYAIADGSVAVSLLRPLDFCGLYLAQSLGGFLVNTLVFSAPFLILFGKMGKLILPTPQRLLLFLASVGLGYLIMFYFSFCFSMLVFYTTYFFGINMAKAVTIRLCSGALIPLSFFPDAIEKMFSFLPFSSMVYTPVMIWLGKLDGTALCTQFVIQLFWVLIFFVLSKFCWRAAVRRITVLGG